jgi:N-acetylneuraminic acid mutarotase
MKNANRIHKLLFLLTLISFALGLCGINLYRAALAQGGSWQTKASTPTPISGHAVGVAGGKLYSVGGSNGAPCCNIFPAPTFAYDPTANTWTTRMTMSVKRKNLAAGVINGVLYAVGGDNDFSYFPTNEAYNPANDTWAVKASMPTARSFPSAGVANGILYVVGGENNITGTLTTVEAYDPATNSWSTKAPMSQRRSRGHAVAVVNDTLYVIGGYDTNTGMTLNTVEAYDPITNTWSGRSPMLTARHALAAAAVNGMIYAIGGFNNGSLSTVEAYDPATNTWATSPSLATARASLGAAEVNGVIYAVGGGTPVAVATVEAFTPTPPTCVTPPPGMVSWWPGEGSADDIKDSNNGILQGGATFGAGKVGQAFSFDGINGLVLVSSASNLDLEQAFTIDAWVNLAEVNSAQCIVCKGLVDNHQYAILTGGLAAPDELNLLVRRQASASDGLDRLITVNQAHLVPNRWYHIAATADGTNKSIYLDGQLLATNSAVAPYTTFSPAVEIGSGNGGTVAFFHGMIDEVEIYDRALTQAEIQAIYNAGSAGKCKPSANNAPIAVCQSVTVSASPTCAADASINNGSSDPDGDPITITQTPAGPYSLGSTAVTMTVTDSHGASSSCTATVNVVDNTPPQITSIPADASYQCAGQVPPAAPSQATATDNCGTPTITVSDSNNGGAGSISNPLIITRTYTATDAAGNHASLSQQITVIDNTPPTVSCPTTPATLSVGANCLGVIPDVTGLVSASDNCTPSSSLTKSQNPAAGTVVGVGTRTVTVRVTDSAGNSGQCTVTFNVVDNTPPTITCPPSKTVECAGQTGAVATFTATASDNCDPNPSVGCSPPSGSVFPKGSTSVTCTATDASGNSSSNCSFTVAVADTTPPVITLNGANPMTIECHTGFTDPGATANDTCAGSLSVTTSGIVNVNAVGAYTLTYSATDPAGLTGTKTRTVNVVDTTPPKITLNGPSPMTTECHAAFTDPGATASDACAGSVAVTASGSVNANAIGTYTITYAASDGTNTATNTRQVNVVDTTPPTITLSGSSPMTVECHASFNNPGAHASDACAGDLSSRITVAGSVNVNVPGTYTLTYSVSDPTGNAAPAVTRTVNVVDTTAPSISCPPAVTVECAGPAGATATYSATASDACDAMVSAICSPLSGSVFPKGTTTVSCTAKDASNNSSSCSFIVTVADTRPPVITINGANPLTVECHTSFSDPGATANDVCAGPVAVTPTGMVNVNDPGTYVITYMASDGTKTATAVRTVNVVDTTPPVIACPTVSPAIANLGSSSAAVSYPAPTASDNCGLGSVACSPPSGFSFPLGTTTVTCTATDSRGNSSSCSFTVTVLTPQQALTQLVTSIVNDLVARGVLTRAQGNAFIAAFQVAIQQLNQSNRNLAINLLRAVVNDINLLVRSGRLTAAQAQPLIDAINNIIAHL